MSTRSSMLLSSAPESQFFNSIRNLKITRGDVVAVQGLGGLGHLAVQYANKMGYKAVALSSGDKKRDFAKKLGAHEYIDTSKDDPAKLMELWWRRAHRLHCA